MQVLKGQKPENVWEIFEAMCAIPHGSGNTEKIADWLTEYALSHGLKAIQDAAGNVIIYVDATEGYEAAPILILQAHMDMVCDLEPGCTKDMQKEGLELFLEDGQLGARGTTLGGDDGIGVALALALATDKTVQRPALELVFTAEEEVGMGGVKGLDGSLLKGRRMLNLDNEGEGVFTVSCAGGVNCICRIPLTREESGWTRMELTLSGFTGGHSGGEIHHGRGNANILMGRVLQTILSETEMRLISVDGGLKYNAIPLCCKAVLAAREPERVKTICEAVLSELQNEYAYTDPKVTLSVQESRSEDMPMDEGSTRAAAGFLHTLPDGVFARSKTMENMVQTSSNLGILKTSPNELYGNTFVRSSVESQKRFLASKIAAVTALVGGRTELAEDFPGWEYAPESPLRKVMESVFVKQYGHAPEIAATHAGMECGLFCGKLPGLDCVSAGPTVTEIHTYRERLDVASTERTYALLCAVVKELNA